MISLNMLGKPCPIPVVEAKKILLQGQDLTVLVDNSIAVQNLEKMAAGLGFDFSYKQQGEAEFAVTIMVKAGGCKPASCQAQTEAASPDADGGVIFLITGDQIGISAEEPGKKLMQTFLYSLAQLPKAPELILLLNAGVKLAAQGSEVLDNLKTLAEHGADIRSCGQCLNYYGLTEKLAVGKITNMMEIVEFLTSSRRTVTI
ncbi:MAG: sulfurtransferase-like selenium metabolism protein YedF [Treponema sp.]|jgi:selenium metabolism protein YedF|nr:sulfurtransferase-like selenium metabolism protein YedF [Treponema sp.]